MAHRHFDEFECDYCGLEVVISEDEPLLHPSGWMSLLRGFIPEFSEDFDPESHLFDVIYCSEGCLLDAIHRGDLDGPE